MVSKHNVGCGSVRCPKKLGFFRARHDKTDRGFPVRLRESNQGNP